MQQSVAIVTGGESGIGAACVAALAASGANVVATYFKDEAAANAVAQAAGSDRVRFVRADVGEEAAVDAVFQTAATAFGTPMMLVNSAGLNMTGVKLVDMPLEQFQCVLSADLTGAFLTCRAFARAVEKAGAKGRIVNISSIHEKAPRAGGVDYDSAKGGLSQLTATLALELAPAGIAVNGVAPGMILTPMNAHAMEDADYRRKLEANIPWGRAGRPEEVAKLVLFLLSSDADYITGTTVTIDGALSLTVAQGA